jgi:hypothetical protein
MEHGMFKARKKLLALGGALLLTVAIAGAAVTLGGARPTLAAPGTPGAARSAGDQQELADFYAKLASNLKISQDALVAAVKQSDLQQIDAAITAGTLTSDQAQAARDRINNSTGLPPLGIGDGHHGPGGPGGKGGPGGQGGPGGPRPSGSPAPSTNP